MRLRRILDLDAAPDIVAEKLIRTGIPEQEFDAGLRIPGVWCDFEAGCRAVLGQQVSVKGAITAVTRLVTQLGEKQGDHLYFPTAQRVADDDLSWLPMPNARRQALRSLARYYAEHPGSDPKDWISIKGIGPWTIAYSKMRGLSDPDIFLDGDLVIRKALEHNQVNSDDASPWRSYLTFQLWSMS